MSSPQRGEMFIEVDIFQPRFGVANVIVALLRSAYNLCDLAINIWLLRSRVRRCGMKEENSEMAIGNAE